MRGNLILVVILQLTGSLIRTARHWFGVGILVGMCIGTSVGAPLSVPASRWDRSIPDVKISQTDIQSTSLRDAWQTFSRRYAVRSVLCVIDQDDPEVKKPFEFKRGACTVKDFLDALTSAYGFMWTQDATGVIWLYPTTVQYTDILSKQVLVREDEFGLPMYTGVLGYLQQTLSPEYLTANHTGTLILFLNNFDYPVDLPKGVYTAGDILNLCCVADPARTFGLVRPVNGDGRVNVWPIGLHANPPSESTPEGALQFWNVEVGSAQSQCTEPRRNHLCTGKRRQED